MHTACYDMIFDRANMVLCENVAGRTLVQR